MFPWSVTATAFMPASLHDFMRSGSRIAPSSRLYSVCRCRCVKSAGIARTMPRSPDRSEARSGGGRRAAFSSGSGGRCREAERANDEVVVVAERLLVEGEEAQERNGDAQRETRRCARHTQQRKRHQRRERHERERRWQLHAVPCEQGEKAQRVEAEGLPHLYDHHVVNEGRYVDERERQ